MGVRFRRSFKLFPGVRVNVGLRGVSTSIGVRGAHLTVGPRGVRASAGVPGTGLSYSQRLDKPRLNQPADDLWPNAETPVYEPTAPAAGPSTPRLARPSSKTREISSGAAETLTSKSLAPLRDMLTAARKQMAQVDADIAVQQAELLKLLTEHDRKTRSLFRFFHRKRIRRLAKRLIPELNEELDRLNGWKAGTRIAADFATEGDIAEGWGLLVRSFDTARQCAVIWDIMRDQSVDRRVARSSAERTVERKPVSIDFIDHDLVAFDGKALRFGNANGDELLFYPGLVLVPRADGAMGLIDPRDIQVKLNAVRFLEEQAVPADTEVVDRSWAKVNKDGSPDRRFADNYQIPVCLYARVELTSPTGLNEEYQFSNYQAGAELAAALMIYGRLLRGEAPE